MEATVRDELRIALRRGRSDQDTDAWAWRAGTDGRSSSGAVLRQVMFGLEAGPPRHDRRYWGNRVESLRCARRRRSTAVGAERSRT